MTKPSERKNPDKEIPEITSEEDAPFPEQKPVLNGSDAIDKKLGKADDLEGEITKFRYTTGRTVLYISMAAMGASAIIDLIASALGKPGDLITSTFEAFKLITMTVLGYIFGSNSSKS